MEKIACEYLKEKKGWKNTDYQLEILPQKDNSSLFLIAALHKDDANPARRGAGKSVQLHIDLFQRRVVKELGYQ